MLNIRRFMGNTLYDDSQIVARQHSAGGVDNRFRFQCREDLVIEPEVSTAHFGMIQDALTNIARHAQATHRRATLTRQWKTG